MDILDNDEEEFDILACAYTRAIEAYYLKYVHKTPCMNFFQTGNIWLIKVLQANYSLKGSRRK